MGMKSREFVRKFINPTGATLEKKDGDHYVYRLPSGRTIIVPMGGSQSEIAPYLISKLKRLLKDQPLVRA
jgi:predicted RNA binding protein YcfA (HicA-like mRNA interferase family)